MDDILTKSLIEKVEAQENKIAEIRAAIGSRPDNSELIEHLNRAVESMEIIVKEISFPVQEMKELSKNITECRKQFSQPVKNDIRHHHYFPKIIWISIGLFLALGIACSGWYMTAGSLEAYRANDTKYRYLKLYGSNPLKAALFFTDSLHRIDPGMRDSVIRKEEENRQVFELLQEAERKEKEAEELKRKASQHH